MRGYLKYSLLIVLAACGKDSVSPPPPPPPPVIVQLIMAPDTGFWRGSALRLPSLVRGAITDQGDTVAAPAVTWTLPTGFVRQGDSVLAMREARGAFAASVGSVASSTITTSVTDLSEKTWVIAWRCYNNTVIRRDVEDPPIGQDSIVREYLDGTLSYITSEWDDLRGTIAATERVIRFWKDGMIDTTIQSSSSLQMIQDTATAAVYVRNVENLKMESDTPRVYRAAWNSPHTTWCDSGYLGGGSDFILREP
jgi:hypothetical protein